MQNTFFAGLYLIEILHQTTTLVWFRKFSRRCILSKFYIKPQPGCEVEPWSSSCILSKFYIKPQQKTSPTNRYNGCILSKFYIKPQQRVRHTLGHSVVSYRNSTSNHNVAVLAAFVLLVVSYRNSTSNHNRWHQDAGEPHVVSYRNSTSNHNFTGQQVVDKVLYLIEILHQTTTLTHVFHTVS